MSKKYANHKTLVRAIRRINLTEPKKPLKGRGHERHDDNCFGELFREVLKNHPSNHIATVYARRSTKAHNPMQFGGDQDVISPELRDLVAMNEHLLAQLEEARRKYDWFVDQTKE